MGVDIEVMLGEYAGVELAYYAELDNQIAAVGGYVRCEGRLWAFLDVYKKCNGMTLIRALRDQLDIAAEPVLAPRNPAHPNSERLLLLLGFSPTDEVHNGMVVWQR